MPISIAVAPAKKNSIASVAFIIPPIPMTGIFTAFETCHTMRKAIGLTAGPDKPPVMVDKIGFLFSASIAIPKSVFIKETLSAPLASATRAISVISVTLGDSFTINVL